MGRFYSEDGPEYPIELWETNLQRAIKGRRGQRFLDELQAALEALPEPRLIEDSLYVRFDPEDEWTNNKYDLEPGKEAACAIGAIIRWRILRDQRCYLVPRVKWVRRGARLTGRQKRNRPDDPQISSLDSLAEVNQEDPSGHYEMLVATCDVPSMLAWHIGWMNDELWEGLEPETRYNKFLEWIAQNRQK